MSMRNLVNYHKQRRQNLREVWFTGDVALKKGMGLCCDMDYVTTETGWKATDKLGARGNYVQVPVAANSLAFAGVTTQSYAAKEGGQFVTIAEPGSVCEILAGGVATTLNSTLLTCSAQSIDAGRFTLGGFAGRGSALALQTVALTALTANAFASWTGTATAATTTITATGIGTACGYGADPAVDATDFTVYVAGGGDDDEVSAPSAQQVLTAPTADTITVGTSVGTTTFNAVYVVRGNGPLILAELLDGPESGLIEYVSPSDNVAAQHALPGGVTFICGGYTLTTGDSTSTLADGVIDGQRKGFANIGTLTTHGYIVTVTSGLTLAGGALANITQLAAGIHHTLEWHGNFGNGSTGAWRALEGTGTEA